MKVEHITVSSSSSNNSIVRDTDIILPLTRDFFKPLQAGNITMQIENTPFVCEVVVEGCIALFKLKVKNEILCMNLCCFRKEDKETALKLLKNIYEKYPLKGTTNLPQEDKFIITTIINPFVSFSTLPLAAEIELYIYDAIYEGLKDRNVFK